MVWPFHQSMEGLRPGLRAICDRDFLLLDRFHVLGRDLFLYARPAVRAEGMSGEWITSDGLTLIGRADVLRRFPCVNIRGQCDLRLLDGDLHTAAFLGDSDLPVQATLTERTYQFRIVLGPDAVQALSDDGTVKIRVVFDRAFVPQERGMGEDTRHLVVLAPEEIRLTR
jgi:hypothetical protein